MSLFGNCAVLPIPDITKQDCGINIGQIQKIAIWGRGATTFTPTTILTSTGWSTAVALTTAGKPVITNYLTNVAIPNSTAVEQTADTNINAMPELQRGSNVKMTAASRSLGALHISELKAITPYSQVQPGVTQVGCVFINQDNQVIYNANSGDLLFPIFNWFVSDTDVKGQLGALNEVMIEAYLKYGWGDTLAIGQASFDLLNSYPV